MATIKDLVGSVDNLDEPRGVFNYKSGIFGHLITSWVITTICVCMRVYIRFRVTRTPGADDYLILITCIVAWGANISCCLLVKFGLGEHYILLGETGMSNFSRTYWWCNACYNMALALVKLSLLSQYLRLLQEHPNIRQPKLRKTIMVLMVMVSVWGFAWSFLSWVPCIPISAHWDLEDTSAMRWGYGSWNVEAYVSTYYNHAATNMALDLIIIALPMVSSSLWTLVKGQEKARFAMLGLFFLGALSVTCSIVRFAYIVKSRATTSPTFDPSWYGARTIVLSVMEVDFSTMVGSLPVFWPHLGKFSPVLVTQEFEVKITRQSQLLGKSSSRNPSRAGTRWDAGAHWDAEVGVYGPRARNEVIMMRELSITSTNTEKAFSIADSTSPSLGNSGSVVGIGRGSMEVLVEEKTLCSRCNWAPSRT